MKDEISNGPSPAELSEEEIGRFKSAVRSGDADRLRELFAEVPALKASVNEPWFSFDSPALLVCAGNREMVDALLEAGADINARSQWWAGGFGALDSVTGEQADYLISRGAIVDVHAAAHLGMLDRVKEWVEADPACVNARGGDGQTPLHFASSVEIVDYLLDHGAEIDLRDIDHGGTAAQWSINQPDKLRRLMERRAEPDVFIACALGDLDLAKRILDADSDALKSRVGQGAFTSGDSDGGHIYVYELGYETRPLHLAGEKGNTELVDFLLQRSSPTEQFLYACWMADETMAQSLVSKHPDLVRNLPPEEMRLISDAAWAHKVDAVRVMLNVGFDVNARGACDSTPLDRAAIHGNRDLVELLLAHRASLEVVNEFGGNPFSACIWGSENFRSRNGDYPGCVERMISAGAPIPKEARGSREVREVLMRYGAAA